MVKSNQGIKQSYSCDNYKYITKKYPMLMFHYVVTLTKFDFDRIDFVKLILVESKVIYIRIYS